jgi:ATP-dependent helicase/nuclease subunit B
MPRVELRPRSLYVTDVEMWRRDPYGLYAKRILRLRALDPLDASPDAADFGNLLHGAFADFLRLHPVGDLPAGALDELIEHGRRHLEQNSGARPAVRAFWEPRLIRAAAWFVEHEQGRRGGLYAHPEIAGQLALPGPAGPFILQARADRVDRAGGHLVVIDYKTGQPPRASEVADGYAPQLPLEAAIAQAGGFADVPAVPVGALEFWRFGGGREPGSVQPAGGTKADPIQLADDSLAGLVRMVAEFDKETTPYRARPHPDYAPAYSDYGHLARVPEWQNDEGTG